MIRNGRGRRNRAPADAEGAWPERDALNEQEPWLVDQVEKRALLICRHDYWPELTPERLWNLPAEMWVTLALACDAIAKQRADEADELKKRR